MKILVMLPFTDADKARLAETAPDSEIKYGMKPSDFTAYDYESAEIFIGQCPPDKLGAMKALRLLQLSFAGTDAYVKPGVLPEGVTLTNATGAYGLAISEYMVGAVLTFGKKFHLYRDNMREHEWLDRGGVMSVYGSVVLTVGLGDIGGSFARLMKGLGAYNIAIKRRPSDKPDYVDELYLADRLDEMLPCADIVALALPGGMTAGMLSRERIALMKNTALLVNVGRGSAVDTEALCDALIAGSLGGAVLDVTDPEPLPKEHRLWSCENAIITPHVSGYYHHPATFGKIVDIAISNVAAYQSGAPLKNIIDLSTGYAK